MTKWVGVGSASLGESPKFSHFLILKVLPYAIVWLVTFSWNTYISREVSTIGREQSRMGLPRWNGVGKRWSTPRWAWLSHLQICMKLQYFPLRLGNCLNTISKKNKDILKPRFVIMEGYKVTFNINCCCIIVTMFIWIPKECPKLRVLLTLVFNDLLNMIFWNWKFPHLYKKVLL